MWSMGLLAPHTADLSTLPFAASTPSRGCSPTLPPQNKLAERESVDRAKRILMDSRGLPSRRLRRTAQDRDERRQTDRRDCRSGGDSAQADGRFLMRLI
jgi:hypothetical protein